MERRMLRYVVKVQRMEDSRLTRRVFEECWVERSWCGEEVGGSWLGVRKRLRKFVNRTRWREEVCGKRSLDLY